MKGKIIVPLLLASSVTAGVVATTNQNHLKVHAQEQATLENVVGDLVEVTNFKSTGTLGDKVYLPDVASYNELGVENAVKPVATVTDPTGRKLANSEFETDGTGTYFVPKLKGYYTLTYSTSYEDQLDTITSPLRIYVEGANFRVVLPTNSKYVVPAKIATSSTDVLKIPAPTVFEGDEVIEDAVESGKLEVYVLAKDGTSSETPLTATKDDNDEYFYSWTPSQKGIYEIVYKYVDGTVQDYKTQRFVVEDNYDTSNIVLNFSYAGTKPTTAVLKQETKLPKINVINRTTGNSIEAHTKITVQHIASGELFTVSEKDGEFVFTPTKTGRYRVTYQAVNDYFGVSSVENSFIIEDVKDTIAPTVLAVNKYEKDADGKIVKVFGANNTVLYDAEDSEVVGLTDEEKQELINKALSDLRHAIPSVVALVPTTEGGTTTYSKTVEFPAIFASDNASDLKDITLTRTIRRSSTGVVSEITGDAHEVGTFTFSSSVTAGSNQQVLAAGEYTVRYVAKDAAGNETLTSFDLKVVASDAELKVDNEFTKPTVNLQALPAYVRTDAKITFNAPTASDAHDTRVYVKTTYSFNAGSGDEVEITEKNENGQLVLQLNSDIVPAGATELYVKAYGYNDYAPTATVVTRTVKLINTGASAAPEFIFNKTQFLEDLAEINNITAGVIDQDGYLYKHGDDEFLGEPFSQKDVVTLPEVKITDDSDPNLQVSVTVVDPFGKTVNLSNTKFKNKVIVDEINETTTYEYTISEGKFTANYSGLYKVTYTARDASGNIIVKSVGIRIKDTEAPTILLSSYDPFVNEVEVGKFVTVPAASLKDNGVIIENLTYGYREAGKAGVSWRLENSANVELVHGIGFTPKVAGTYVVIYEGWDASGIETESKAYTVVAKDTTKPTIVLENDYILPTAVPYTENQPIKLPGIVELYDGGRDSSNSDNDFDQTPVDEINLQIKVTDANGKTINHTSQVETTTGGVAITRYSFIPASNGVYTVRYTATDRSGNTQEIVKTLEVGDVNAPTLEWKNNYSVITTAKLGDQFELNLNNAVISDDEDEVTLKDNATIVMYGPDNKQVASLLENGYKWEFEKVGTYEIRITLKDKSNNTKTYNYSITVSEDTQEGEVIAPWLGTTLIVASVVILGGTILYFVVTSKGGFGAKKVAKKRTTKK